MKTEMKTEIELAVVNFVTEAFVLADHLVKITKTIKDLAALSAESADYDYSKDAEIVELETHIEALKYLLSAVETNGIILDESGVLLPKPPTKN